MANIKDLFKSYANNQSLVSKSLNDTDPGVESADYSNASLEVQNKVEPYVDFAAPENFAFYGFRQAILQGRIFLYRKRVSL